jgi:creatinine amidohydrolase
MRWEELTSAEIGALDRDKTIVILPLGSVEQHGNHLPLGTDTMLAQAVSLAAADATGDTVVMPPPWYGFSAHHMRFPGSVTLRPETFMAIVEDMVAALVRHDFHRILMVNGHGGNSGLIDVLASTLGHAHYGAARIACEFETSMVQHIRPELVKIDRAETTYPDPGSPYLTTDLLGAQAIRLYHDFGDLSPTGTLGDPAYASPEAGRAFFAAVTDELIAFITDFRRWTIPERRT